MDIKEKTELSSLIIESLDGNITPERLRRLDQLLSQDPDAVEHYVRHLRIYSAFVRRGQIYFDTHKADIRNMELWDELAEYEKNAPTVEIETPEPEKMPVEMLKIEKGPRVINKFSLFSAFISAAAAVLFMVIYVKYVPTAASSVATIEDSVNAQWSPSEYPTKVGERLWNNEGTRWLQKGMVKIAFDYGAEVIIEGPAEFKLESPDKMYLSSGRLYSTVPAGATGFIVQTPYSTIIDLGTEFGVKVDFDGSTDVHMFKGKASLIPGSVGEKKEGVEILASQAKAVNVNSRVQEIALEAGGFVRKFDSKAGLLWRGESLNLADIVGGGDGFGTGRQGQGVNPYDGAVLSEVGSLALPKHKKAIYQRVDEAGFIEGVFIPDGGFGRIPISSRDILSDCPDTSGSMNIPIMNGLSEILKKVETVPEISLQGQRWESKDSPVILLHTNAGITFDLQAMRKAMPGVAVGRFSSLAGISETIGDVGTRKDAKAEMWVILDGEIKFRRGVRADAPIAYEIDLALSEESRFLTLMTTDGGDGVETDWCLFARPRLILE